MTTRSGFDFRHAFPRILPALAFYGLIVFLSSLRRIPLNAAFPESDKLAHFAVFSAFGVLLAFGVFPACGRLARTRIGLIWLAGAIGGILDELHQLFVPGRSCDAWDAAADALGVALGLALFLAWRRHRRRAFRPPEASPPAS